MNDISSPVSKMLSVDKKIYERESNVQCYFILDNAADISFKVFLVGLHKKLLMGIPFNTGFLTF